MTESKMKLEHNEYLKRIVDSLNIKLEYPVIMFCHVAWDFKIYCKAQELINDSIYGHWALNNYFSGKTDENEMVIDSKGRIHVLDHNHYDKAEKTAFSYPSNPIGLLSVEELKIRITNGVREFVNYIYPEMEEEIKAKLITLQELDSFEKIILFVNNEFKFND